MTLKHRTEYLSKSNSDCLKGLFALAIIVCHLFAKKGFGISLGLGPIFSSLGYLSVAIFLFASGYGLTVSYIGKGKDYLQGFLRKRVLPIYIINFILILVYTLYDLISGNEIIFKTFFQSFLFGDTIVKYGWYIQMILLFYIIYYLCFKFFAINKGIVVLMLFILLYCVLCVFGELSSTWYECSGAFLLGVIWAKDKQKIDRLCSGKKYFLCFIITTALFIITYILGNARIFSSYIRISIKFISAIAFVALILLILMKIKIDIKPVRFFGKYFFEMYILQGLFISLFDEMLVIENTVLYCTMCFLCTLGVAIIIHPLVQLINKKCK